MGTPPHHIQIRVGGGAGGALGVGQKVVLQRGAQGAGLKAVKTVDAARPGGGGGMGCAGVGHTKTWLESQCRILNTTEITLSEKCTPRYSGWSGNPPPEGY